MESLTFSSKDDFARRIKQMAKYQKYARRPVGKQIWVYGDGHVAETEWGRNGGTVASNFSYIANIIKAT
jgi:hypothetical protein